MHPTIQMLLTSPGWDVVQCALGGEFTEEQFREMVEDLDRLRGTFFVRNLCALARSEGLPEILSGPGSKALGSTPLGGAFWSRLYGRAGGAVAFSESVKDNSSPTRRWVTHGVTPGIIHDFAAAACRLGMGEYVFGMSKSRGTWFPAANDRGESLTNLQPLKDLLREEVPHSDFVLEETPGNVLHGAAPKWSRQHRERNR